MPTGPYQVGNAQYDLEDPYRKELKYPNGRLIPIQIYFPMGTKAHVLNPKIIENRARAPFGHLEVQVYSQKADLSLLVGNEHPVVFLNHASDVAMTDYAVLAEDLCSHGYIVISIQHDLQSDAKEPEFWEKSSCSRNAKVIDNILFVFEWLKISQDKLFAGKINLKSVGFIGHSLGANSLLLWVNRNVDIFKNDSHLALLPREDQRDVKECLILMEATRFCYPLNKGYPAFFLQTKEREEYQREAGYYEQMMHAGHLVRYYQGATHISFMDHGFIKSDEIYFKGTLKERVEFLEQVRREIREFLDKSINDG